MMEESALMESSDAFLARIRTMNSPRAVAGRDSVLDCGSPLPLFPARAAWESARDWRSSKPGGFAPVQEESPDALLARFETMKRI